jgi:NADPH-dependent curcumin reductase CurA
LISDVCKTENIRVTDGLKIKAGDTVVISAATGATGSIACQIAKILGARVIGIAGGAEKCRWVTQHAGCDAAIDYRSEDLSARLAELAPDGVDAYFDNVGGDMLDTMFLHMAPRGRILICGAMSQGYTDVKVQGPTNYMRICTHQLTVQGILLFFYADQIPAAAAQLGAWVMQGRIHVEENLHLGFDKAPELLPTMFTGKAPGKLLLKVDGAA